MDRRLLPASLILALAVLAACSEPAPPPKPPEPKPVAKVEPKPAAAGAAVAASSGRSDPECVGPIDTGVPETVDLGGRKAEVNGYQLKLLGDADADDQAVIGVIANANEASGENLLNLQRYLAILKENKAELIVLAGDSGDDKEGIQAVLKAVSEGGLPVLAIAGNRESKADYVDAINALRKERPNLINGNRVRLVEWDDVSLVTLPGYHDPRYIHAGAQGCQYYKEDVAALQKAATGAKGPLFLVSHGGPKGTGPAALDVIEDKSNVGDSAINDLLAGAKIAFGVFPNIKESGARAVSDAAGTTKVAEGTLSDSLYLNPGSADSLPWTMNDGSTAQGMFAVVTVKGKQASYKLFRAAPLTEADKAAAAKLVPAPAPTPEGAAAKNE